MKRLAKKLWFRLLCLGLAVSGCYAGYGYYYDPYYGYVYYDPYWYYYDAGFTYVWVDPFGTSYYYLSAENALSSGTQDGRDLTKVAQGLAAANSNVYSPAGCVTSTQNGTTVALTFANCTSPQGKVNGRVITRVSENDGHLVFTTTSDSLQINDAPFVVDTVTTVDQAEQQRRATVVSHSRDPRQLDSRDAQMTVSWQQGSRCLEVSGQGTDVKGDTTLTTTLTGYQRCAEQCPTGGTIAVVTQGKQLSGTYDGSQTFVVNAEDGRSKTYQLDCQ